MATFPSGIFSWTTLTDNTDDVLAAHPNSIAAEIIALQTKLGADSSAVVTTLDYKIRHLPAQEQNVDIGNYEMRARTFKSDVATGNSPIVIASTTKVSNLNADTVDGKHVDGSNGAGEITTNDGTQTLTNKTLTGATIALGADLDFNDNEAIDFILENRSDDTGMTVTGQMWFRTDV